MLGQKILVQVSSDFFIGAIGFITTILVARFLGPQVLGIIGFTLGLIGLLAFVGDLGFSQAHAKRISEGGKIEEKLATFGLIRIFQTFLFFALGILFFLVSRFLPQQPLRSKEETMIFFLLFFSYFFVLLSSFFVATFQGRQEAVKSNLPQALGKILKLVATVLAIVFFANAVGIATTYVIEAMVVFIFFLFLFKKNQFGTPKFSIFKNYLAYAFPLMIVNSLSYFFGNADRLLLKSFWGTEVVGWYFGVQGLISLPQTLSSSVMTMFFPNISSLFAKKRFDEIKDRCRTTIRYLLLVTVPISVTLVYFRNDIIRIFLGESFLPGSTIMIPFAVLVVIIAVVRPYSNIVFAIEKHAILVKVSLINFFVLIFLDSLLIPRQLFGITLFGLGGVGAAITNVVLWLISGAIQISVVRKNLGIPLFLNIIVRYFLAAGVMYLSYMLMFTFGPFLGFIPKLIITVSFGIFVYLVTLNLLGELSRRDLSYFFKVIKPMTLLKSARKEIKQ